MTIQTLENVIENIAALEAEDLKQASHAALVYAIDSQVEAGYPINADAVWEHCNWFSEAVRSAAYDEAFKAETEIETVAMRINAIESEDDVQLALANFGCEMDPASDIHDALDWFTNEQFDLRAVIVISQLLK